MRKYESADCRLTAPCAREAKSTNPRNTEWFREEWLRNALELSANDAPGCDWVLFIAFNGGI